MHACTLFNLSSSYQDVSGQNQSTILTDFGQGLSTNLHEVIKSREWYKMIQENKKATPTKKPYEVIHNCIYIYIYIFLEFS